MSADYRSMCISKKIAHAFGARICNTYIFKPCYSKFIIFHANLVFGEYLYASHTLFLLYCEGNHTLFGEKLNSIWKFSSGNTETALGWLSGYHVYLMH